MNEREQRMMRVAVNAESVRDALSVVVAHIKVLEHAIDTLEWEAQGLQESLIRLERSDALTVAVREHIDPGLADAERILELAYRALSHDAEDVEDAPELSGIHAALSSYTYRKRHLLQNVRDIR